MTDLELIDIGNALLAATADVKMGDSVSDCAKDALRRLDALGFTLERKSVIKDTGS